MDSVPPFIRFGTSHLWVIALTFLVPAVLVFLARMDPSLRIQKAIRYTLAALLAANMAALVVIGLQSDTKDWIEFLPMHLCDWLGFILLGALIWKKQGLYDLSYFWGLAGTVHGLITPDLSFGFPHPYFFTFHIAHSGVLISVAFLTFACDLRPNPRSLMRAFVGLQIYVLSAAGVNLVLNENFGYLCAKPENPSLMDYMGPWPWYLVTLQGFALASYLITYLPWAIKDALHKKGSRIKESANPSPDAEGSDH